MGIRFAKSIKLGDLLKINISKSGVSATVGKKGASINLGSKGTYLNLSPTIAGITGTGVSYRKKITGGYGDLINKVTGKSSKSNKDDNDNLKVEKKKNNTKRENNDVVENKQIDSSILEEYEKKLEDSINIHKYADNVLTEKEFDNKISSETNSSIKNVYEMSKNGDEDTIESLVGSFMMNLDLDYPVNANFELEEHELFVDLDLPEIENFNIDYPVIENNKIVTKKKTQTQLKQEYALTVMSLSIYLAAEYYNLSSFVKDVVISGFTSKRNNVGDLKDEYIYSIRYTRDFFENTSLKDINDVYEFILKFENRINLNMSNYSFKEIKPFEMPSIEKANSLIEEAISGLKELGYKNTIINQILPKLNNLKFETSSDYLKEALKMISNL